MLSMLRTIGLNDSDIVMLKQYHLQFAEKVIEAKKKFKEIAKRQREKREAAAKQKLKMSDRKSRYRSRNLWQRIDESDTDDAGSLEEELNRRYSHSSRYNERANRSRSGDSTFSYDIDILVEASVVFVSQALGLLMSKLQRQSVTRLDRFAGDIMQSVISNPQTQRRWKELMSSTQSVVTKNAIKNIENVIVPLPKQIEPTTITKFLTDFVLIEIVQRQFFESISRYWVESVTNRNNVNSLTRIGMSMYVIARFSINTAKSLIDDKRNRTRRQQQSYDEYGNETTYASPIAIRKKASSLPRSETSTPNHSPDGNVNAYNGFEVI